MIAVNEKLYDSTRITLEKQWSGIQTLFDDGSYTVICGEYGDGPQRRLAQGCNGPLDQETYPRFAKGWHLVPEFLEIPLLYALLDELYNDLNRQKNASVRDRREMVLGEIKNFHLDKCRKQHLG